MTERNPSEIRAQLHSSDDYEAKDIQVTVPFPVSRAGRALAWALATAEALAFGDGRGVLVVTGKLWRDERRLPEPGGGAVLGQVDLLSASAAKAADVAIFVRQLLQEMDTRIKAFLGWEGD